MSVHPEDFTEIASKINKKYEGSLKRGNEIENPDRIPTGSLELDGAMRGGIPIGRFSRFYGSYSSAKTLTSLNVIREAQKMGLTAAYYNIEKQYDPEFTKEYVGVNVNELTIVEGTTIEEIGDKMEALMGVVHLHVIDSCSAAVSEDELDADIREWRPGISARAWGKVFRRINERFDHFENTVILVDQARSNFRTGGEDAPGGRILDHQSSMTVHFKKAGWLWKNPEGFLDEKAKQKKGVSGQSDPEGVEIKARIEKSRVGRPLLSATMRLDFQSLQFDRVFELLKAAKHYGIVETKGSWFHYKGQKFQGDKGLRDFVAEDEEIQTQILDTVKAASIR